MRFTVSMIFLTMVATLCLLQQAEASWENGNDVWLGEQRISCLHRRRRELRGLQHTHKLVAFKGRVYEWGYRGRVRIRRPFLSDCTEFWDASPSGVSGCTARDATEFTESYVDRYGSYDFLTNNSHHFANRLVQLLLSVCLSK